MEKLRTLKIGRKYKVKSFERLIKEYGKTDREMPNVMLGFNSDMKKLCGCVVTIESEHFSYSHDIYSIKEDNYRWAWTSQMLETSLLEDLIYRRKHE